MVSEIWFIIRAPHPPRSTHHEEVALHVDGGVSEWQEWSEVICDQTCGVNVNGTRTRLRGCDNPLRQGNGKTCKEQGIPQQETSRVPCDQIPKSCGTPINGSYGEWTEWLGECPTSCGVNVRYVLRRNRTCDSPKPQNGGLNCQGSHSEEKTSPCEIPPCPDDIVNGTYGEWSSWVQDLCVDTCGVKVQTVLRRNRSCDNPAPRNGGLPCEGPSVEARQIDCEGVAPCPVLSVWALGLCKQITYGVNGLSIAYTK
ncbi:coadhesin-like [Haliotis asinina]|uniref:coadhesin-like n=1 Tax=Haliotis asinina TaxID=109174 RepID=UPI003531D9E3